MEAAAAILFPPLCKLSHTLQCFHMALHAESKCSHSIHPSSPMVPSPHAWKWYVCCSSKCTYLEYGNYSSRSRYGSWLVVINFIPKTEQQLLLLQFPFPLPSSPASFLSHASKIHGSLDGRRTMTPMSHNNPAPGMISSCNFLCNAWGQFCEKFSKVWNIFTAQNWLANNCYRRVRKKGESNYFIRHKGFYTCAVQWLSFGCNWFDKSSSGGKNEDGDEGKVSGTKCHGIWKDKKGKTDCLAQ